MPVGAAIGVGVVGAGASVVGASKNSKAINKATDAQTAANREAIAAQEKARSENLGLQTPIYNAGLPAMNARNALLGLGGAPAQPSNSNASPNALAMYQGGSPDTSGYRVYGGPSTRANVLATNDLFINPRQTMGTGIGNEFGNTNTGANYNPGGTPATLPAPGGQGGGMTSREAADNAFDIFRDSTGYQFRVNEGQNALNSGFAGSGLLQSGAALKALDDYRQGMASAEFGNYWNMLGEQQNLTTGAANAMSGVNTTYANNAGNLAMAQGNALANAAVAQANNSNAMWGNIANSVGSGVGILAGMGKL